jgi:hypothetical protein
MWYHKEETFSYSRRPQPMWTCAPWGSFEVVKPLKWFLRSERAVTLKWCHFKISNGNVVIAGGLCGLKNCAAYSQIWIYNVQFVSDDLLASWTWAAVIVVTINSAIFEHIFHGFQTNRTTRVVGKKFDGSLALSADFVYRPESVSLEPKDWNSTCLQFRFGRPHPIIWAKPFFQIALFSTWICAFWFRKVRNTFTIQ